MITISRESSAVKTNALHCTEMCNITRPIDNLKTKVLMHSKAENAVIALLGQNIKTGTTRNSRN